MSEIDNLIEKADYKLDIGDYAGALQDYRNLTTIIQPQDGILSNLSTAEKYEQLEFRRSLLTTFPNSIVLRRHLAGLLSHNGFRSESLQHYALLLELDTLPPVDEAKIRLDRFATAWQAKDDATLIEDFYRIWFLADEFSLKLRQILLRIVSDNAKNVESIPILEKIASDEQLPAKVRTFFSAKVKEIQVLAEAMDVLK
jgi:tetratricopeptide (TPR) repeat protein